MIKINGTLKEFLDTIDDSQYYMMAYKFSVQKTFESIRRDFNEWKKSMAPYEKEILKAANKFIGTINPKTGEEYSEIPDIHKNIPKFVKDWYWEGYFQPSEDEMALYFCIKYPDLKLFPSTEFKYWKTPPLAQERPFKDTHELISVYKEKYGKTDSYYENELEMPLIGIKEIDTDKTYLIIAYSSENVIISSFLSDYTPQIKSLNMTTLAASYCFLDNSGMVVTEVV